MTHSPLPEIPPQRLLLEEHHVAYRTTRQYKYPYEIERDAQIHAARLSVSTPEDLMRRRIEMRRLQEALDRMPHPTWGVALPQSGYGGRMETKLRYVGDYVISRLTPDERAYLAQEMILADGELDDLSDWHDGLGNFGMSAGCGGGRQPTEDLMKDLAEFRTNERCTSDEWNRLIQGLCIDTDKGSNARIRRLFEEASGITDEMLWGLKECEEAHEEAREAIDALNERRDELHKAGRDCPRAHINWEMLHPFPVTQLALPTLGKHVGAPEA